MNQWTTPNDENDPRLTPRVRRWLRRQRLTRTDLRIIMSNSRPRPYGKYLLYCLYEPGLGSPEMDDHAQEIGQAAGLDDVTVVVERYRRRVVAVTRRWRRPRVRRPRPRGWSLAFRVVTAAELKLTRHAKDQMAERRISAEDIVFVIRHGVCYHRQGQVYYALRGRDGRDMTDRRDRHDKTNQRQGRDKANRRDERAWANRRDRRDRPGLVDQTWDRLSGAVVVVCPYTTEIITVWNGHEEAHGRLRRRSQRSRRPWWPLDGPGLASPRQ